MVTILAATGDRPPRGRALTLLPAATDRHDPDLARPPAVVSGGGALTRAATRD
jgi:hypothetical protein